MCGIVGAVAERNVVEILLEGLKRLEYRGYDSAGVALLDKDGNLVIIENKLDDTGRDVVWQALKYASYCSSLNKKQIVEIFVAYMTKLSFPLQASKYSNSRLSGQNFRNLSR